MCPLPLFSVYSFWKNLFVIFPKILRILGNNMHRWDLVWLPGPHPVGLLFAYICQKRKKAYFQVIRANLMEQVKHSNRGFRRIGAMAAVALLENVSQMLARAHLTFTVGSEMYKLYRRRGGMICETRISLVSEKDIDEARRSIKERGPHDPLRLLSVGRLDPEKGLSFLIEAVDELIKARGMRVVLRIVGKGYKGQCEERLKNDVRSRGLEPYIEFAGYIAHGPQLFQTFRESDMYILPSLTGEGVPQTLFEAMAFGVAIVATRVAGIAGVINHKQNGLLIGAGSAKDICAAIEWMLGNPEGRERIVRNGLETARLYTLEAERDRMLQWIRRYYGPA
jgi:glycosyltransferase involved in cell wall biosynthesis